MFDRRSIIDGMLGFARETLDIVLPPRCLACGAIVADPGSLCAACWPEMGFIGDPVCAVCGLPLAEQGSPDMRCGDCLRVPPEFDRARAALRYDERSSPLILRFKHADG